MDNNDQKKKTWDYLLYPGVGFFLLVLIRFIYKILT